MEQLLGRPKDDPAKVKDMLLAGAMDSIVGDLVETGEKLCRSFLGLVEQPDFRLAGAEERGELVRDHRPHPGASRNALP